MTVRRHYAAAVTVSLLLHLSVFALWREPGQSLTHIPPPLLIRLQGRLSHSPPAAARAVSPDSATQVTLPTPRLQPEAAKQEPQLSALVKESDSAMEAARGRQRAVRDQAKAVTTAAAGSESHRLRGEQAAARTAESSPRSSEQEAFTPNPSALPPQDVATSMQALADARSARPSQSAAASWAKVEAIRSRYEQVLFAWLSKNKSYPLVARRRRLEGDPKLRIVISRSGNVVHCEFLRRSGHAVLDEATLRMVAAADPFPPMPDDYPGDRFEFIAPLSFRAR